MQIARVSAFAFAAAVATTLSASTAIASAAMSQETRAGVAQVASLQAGAHGLPYTDPDQVGLLTLCGTNLKPVTSGSIDAKPFVWRVVSSMAAPKGFFVKGAKATMFAYQPRQYTPAGAWSGMQMASASLYSNPAHPMAQFTPIDLPLKDMVESFPPIWNHLYELRLYLSAPNVPALTTAYAAADVAVRGSTWSLVYGGHASCTTGQAESVETVVGMPGSRGTPKPVPSGSASPSSSASGAGSLPSPGSSGPFGATPVASSSSSSSGTAAAITFGVIALVIVAAVPGALWWRRRRRATG